MLDRELLVVTCLRDREQFLVQAKSIHRYLNPSDITIVLNEIGDQQLNLKTWFYHNCIQYYINHNLNIMFPEDFNLSIGDGYIRQQLIKLLFFQHTEKKEYCILDSKNWLSKNINLSEFRNKSRIELDPRSMDLFQDFFIDVKILLKKNSVASGDKITPIETPYVIDSMNCKQLIKDNFKTIGNFIKWFSSFPRPSEFLLYDLYLQSVCHQELLSENHNISKIFWTVDGTITEKKWNSFLKDESIKIIGIHKTPWKKLTENQKTFCVKSLDLFEI